MEESKKERSLYFMRDKPLRNEAISQLVLASSSPRRKELVAMLDLSLPVYILSTDTDETVEAGWIPSEVVEKLSLRKANAALKMLQQKQEHESSLIIGADTIVVLDGEVLGKPVDDTEAMSMLGRLQGRSHEVYTGIACVLSSNGEASLAHRMTKVKMKALSNDQIARYVATGEPRDKAGAYGIQGLGSILVDEIAGCYFNVVGLPLSLLSDMLDTYDISVF